MTGPDNLPGWIIWSWFLSDIEQMSDQCWCCGASHSDLLQSSLTFYTETLGAVQLRTDEWRHTFTSPSPFCFLPQLPAHFLFVTSCCRTSLTSCSAGTWRRERGGSCCLSRSLSTSSWPASCSPTSTWAGCTTSTSTTTAAYDTHTRVQRETLTQRIE